MTSPSKSLLFDDYEIADLRPQGKAAPSGRPQGVAVNKDIRMF